MDKLRMLFSKTGRAVYISHLDLMHTMQRAFSRAGYELKYSEGFNPHPQISIALPLSVGTGSVCEIMDFVLKDDPADSDLPKRLSDVLPEGIAVLETYGSARKVSEIKWLEVVGRFEYDSADIAEMTARLTAFFSQNDIIISKKTKRGVGESNIKSAVRSISFEPEDGAVKVTAVISAQEPTLNPSLLAEALRQLCPEIAPVFDKFTRLEIYDAEMNIFR